MSLIGKSLETERRLMVARAWDWDREEWGVTVNRYEVSF